VLYSDEKKGVSAAPRSQVHPSLTYIHRMTAASGTDRSMLL